MSGPGGVSAPWWGSVCSGGVSGGEVCSWGVVSGPGGVCSMVGGVWSGGGGPWWYPSMY